MTWSEEKWKSLRCVWLFWDPMDHTVHGILQARILEWVVFPFTRGSSWPRTRTRVFRIAGKFFTNWAIREALIWHSEKAMAPHSSTPAWKIPWMEEPGSLQSMVWHPTPVLLPGKSHGGRSLEGCSPWGHWGSDDRATSVSLFTFMHWRRKWQPTPVFLPGESQGRGSLVGCCLWGHTELDTTKVT